MPHKTNSALVIGGSNGLGYAIVQELQNEGYKKIIVFDRVPPESSYPDVEYVYGDLSKNRFDISEDLMLVDTLIITAGIGRLAPFDTFNETEIKKTFQVNAVSIIQIIKMFYSRLKSKEPFYCTILSSVSGIVSSPLFSLYGATKAALFRFIESVNVELEKEGSRNRILCVCPGTLQGTSFYGAKSDFVLLRSLSRAILENTKSGNTLFIPQYNEIYHDVINRYLENSHLFGLESYDYKIKSDRMRSVSPTTVGYLSGTFDLFHIGHLNLIKRAKDKCDYLVVGVHKDASHKGKETYISFEERCEIVKSIQYVDRVIESKQEDIDVYEDIKYDFLFVGSDYKGSERFFRYEEYFKEKDVKIIYFPYTEGTSSTKLRAVIDTSLTCGNNYWNL